MRGDGLLNHDIMPGEKGPQDQCGVFGVWAPGEEVAKLTYFGLYALQHRGQESAGIATSTGEKILVYKDMGLVSQVFNEASLESLQGHIAVGHTRYSTTGSSHWRNAQPTLGRTAYGTVALGHNGNLTNTAELMELLEERYPNHESELRGGNTTDTAVLSALLTGNPDSSLEDTAKELLPRVKGAYCLVFMDETTAPVLDPGRGRTKTGYLWALARDDRGWGGGDPPGVVFFYAPDRGGQNAEAFLRGFDGTLQLDGYTGYNRLTRATRKGGDPIRVAHCWAHARRKLKEVFDRDGSEIAAEGLRRIAAFYAVEADIRGIAPGQRLSARKARTAPLVAAFSDWLQAQRLRVSSKSRLGEKLAYIHRHWDGLQTFLHDGRVEIDSNPVENLVRPIALNRKNALFAGHDEGGKAWGRIASLIETAKINGVEPFAYLKATLEAIANGHPQNRIDELLPWNFQPSS